LVVEVPLAMIQGSANRAGTYLANNTTIGVWGTTGRTKMRKRHDERENDNGPFIQVQRMGHQLFKTVFLPTAVKDAFNASTPAEDARRVADDVVDILLRLSRELADVTFPDGSGLPGSNALGSRRALDCDFVRTPPPAGVDRGPVPCPDRRVLAVIQGTDFIEPDAFVTD